MLVLPGYVHGNVERVVHGIAHVVDASPLSALMAIQVAALDACAAQANFVPVEMVLPERKR